MSFKTKTLSAIVLATSTLFGLSAQAGTIIYNTGSSATATVALGVNDDGSLNTTPNITQGNATGLAYKFSDGSWQDATSPGCLCEGWGVSANGTSSGWANQNFGGATNLSFGVATGVSGSTVTTTATLTSLSGLKVTQSYKPSTSAPGALFEVLVTITNTTGSALTNVKYVRVMDWDVPPTEFTEFVTIKGTSSTTLLEESGANGFNSSDPLAVYGASGYGCHNVDCTDAGAADHGAYFRFNFGSLADGESYTFSIFYGAAGSEVDALAAVSAQGLELYSFGQSDGGQRTGAPATYIFGFTGVGGEPVEGVPEPGSLVLIGLGLAGLAAARRRKQA
jgi:PEP-CTERM motif